VTILLDLLLALLARSTQRGPVRRIEQPDTR
jgi:hypothetical protein